MAGEMEELYNKRLARYTTTLRNGKADTIPIRPFVAELTARYCGMTCQEVTHDFTRAFDAAVRCAADYDALIADPTGFLYNVWLPRVAGDVCAPGEPVTYRNNLSFVKGGMAMMQYFSAFGPQVERLRRKTGTVSAIAGILKAPFDIIADKLRGYALGNMYVWQCLLSF